MAPASSAGVDTDPSGNVLQLTDYYPFGDSRIEEATGTFHNDYTYTGKERDEDTELLYYEARYYDSTLGRFLSLDPWGGDITDPQSFNKYAYVRNNPLKYVDPDGQAFIIPLVMAAVAVMAGVLAEPQYANAPAPTSNDNYCGVRKSAAQTTVGIADAVSSVFSFARGAIGAAKYGAGLAITKLADNIDPKRQEKIKEQRGAIGNLISRTKLDKRDRSVTRDIEGDWNSANAEFDALTKGLDVKSVELKDGKVIKHATLEDGSEVTLRNFATKDTEAEATIDIRLKSNDDGKTTRTQKVRFRKKRQ